MINAAIAAEQAVEEVPVRNMAVRLGIERGTLQALQKEASVFCGMVVCFCRHLQWHELANVLYSFQVRSIGARRGLKEQQGEAHLPFAWCFSSVCLSVNSVHMTWVDCLDLPRVSVDRWLVQRIHHLVCLNTKPTLYFVHCLSYPVIGPTRLQRQARASAVRPP